MIAIRPAVTLDQVFYIESYYLLMTQIGFWWWLFPPMRGFFGASFDKSSKLWDFFTYFFNGIS